jgi:Concanavalin A-like lectin/glucanases superfamily
LSGNSVSSYLTYPNSAGFRFGTGDFTVEWYQYQISGPSFPRVFSMGTYPSATFAVSIESGTFYFWIGGAATIGTSVLTYNQWVHFAVTRNTGIIKAFRNGTQIGSNVSNAYNFNDTTNKFTVGNEATKSSVTGFTGYITNMRVVSGTSLYNSNFTAPSLPLSATPGTALLLSVANSGALLTDSSTYALSGTGSQDIWSQKTPFPFNPP